MRLSTPTLARLLVAVFAVAVLGGEGKGQTFNPTTGTGSSWNTGANWTPTGVPNAVGASATFQSPTGAHTVNLNAAITVGSITFTNNGTFTNTLANGTGGSLTLDATGSGPATITINGTNTATNNVAISASLVLTDSLTVTNNNTAGTGAATAGFTGSMSGAGGFTKDGLGRVSMTSVAKAFTGATVINQGRLRFTDSGVLTGTSSITVNSGGSLYLDNASGAFTFGTATITINGDGVAETGGQGALRNQGSSISTLANAVVIGGSGATIHADGSSTLRLNGAVSGSGTLTKTGGGTLNFTQAHPNLTGETMVANGTISVNSASSLGTGALTFAQTTGNNTAVTLNNATQTIGNLSSTFADATGTRTQTLTLTGTALTVNQTANTSFGVGAVGTLTSTITGTGSVTKSGTGTLTLAGANTYSGNTTISDGTLRLNGSGSINNSPVITVNSGATFDVATVTGGYSVAANQTLRGQGTVAGAVTVAANGTIRGSNTNNGDLTLTNGLTTLANSTVAVGISGGSASGAAGGSSSGSTNNTLFDITGGTTSLNAGTRFAIDGTGVSFTQFTSYSYLIATGAGDQSGLNINTQSQFTTVGFSADSFLVTGDVGGNIYLQFQPVPEPATVLAVGAAGLGLVGWVRRKRKAKAETAATA